MNFELTEDLAFLRDSARSLLADRQGLKLARQCLSGEAVATDDLWAEIAELGWLGAAVSEEFGGSDLGATGVGVLAEELGRSLAPLPFVSSSIAIRAIHQFASDEQKARLLPDLVQGKSIGSFALRPVSSKQLVLNGAGCSGVLAGLPDGEAANLAVCCVENGTSRSLVAIDISDCKKQAQTGVDPSRPVADITLSGAPYIVISDNAMSAYEQISAFATVLLAFEQLGGAEAALAQAVEQVQGRYAFGRKVASFQAVKHKLADIWVKIELARSCVYYGVWALEQAAEEAAAAAAVAMISSTDAYTTAAEENIHLHGGLGFTWEYDCHLFYKRARGIRNFAGAPHSWCSKLSDAICAQQSA